MLQLLEAPCPSKWVILQLCPCRQLHIFTDNLFQNFSPCMKSKQKVLSGQKKLKKSTFSRGIRGILILSTDLNCTV
jgi:hypothetical protein